MAVGRIGTFEVKQGRGEEFLAVLAEMKKYAEDNGAVVQVRRNMIAGPASGTISWVTLFEDRAARGAHADATAANAANSPLGKMVASADPPATSVSRAFFAELGESSGIADAAPLQMSVIFAVGAGQRDEAEAALLTAKAGRIADGIPTVSIGIALNGDRQGRLAQLSSFDSWSQWESNGGRAPAPIAAAAASGALTRLSQGMSTAINV